jgi:hypothetical protein
MWVEATFDVDGIENPVHSRPPARERTTDGEILVGYDDRE